ncbi:hypothetical protein [Streptomyces sp. NPDC002990]
MTNPMTGPDGGPEGFRPTHVVPWEGLSAWETPDVSKPTVPLDPFLPVQLLSRRGDWGEVLCSNGWSAWVDARLLVAVPQPPPAGGGPLMRAEDPGPLLARNADALERYRRAVDQLASGRFDGEAFQRGTRGLRAGVVVDGECVWLYDEAAGRWLYGDGSRLATYAVVAEPGAPPAPEPPGAASDTAVGADVRLSPPPADRAGGRPDGLPDPVAGHEPTRIVRAPGAGEPGADER